jgi:hypothetical protein
MDLPLLGAETPGPQTGSAMLAAFASPWPGAVTLYREGASPVFVAAARERATIGRLDEALPAGVSGRWDARALRLSLSFGSLSSASEEEVLAGANLLAVETASGFELLQFRDAVLGEDGVWTLSRLLRGQGGTEDRASLGAAAGGRAVLVNAALAEARYPSDLRGLSVGWQAGPDKEFPDTENFAHEDIVLTARAALPLSPVHLRVAPEEGGVRLSWIRRTRSGGDGWESEVPLSEAFERYAVTILDGIAPLRAFEVAGPFADGAGPSVLYTDEEILEDFGAGGVASAADPKFQVAQVSDAVGAGIAGGRGL